MNIFSLFLWNFLCWNSPISTFTMVNSRFETTWCSGIRIAMVVSFFFYEWWLWAGRRSGLAVCLAPAYIVTGPVTSGHPSPASCWVNCLHPHSGTRMGPSLSVSCIRTTSFTWNFVLMIVWLTINKIELNNQSFGVNQDLHIYKYCGVNEARHTK